MIFNMWSEVGEMFGSFILTFSVLMVILISKQESLGLNTNLKRRAFLGLTIPASVLIALMAGKGFGAHGQLNPSITLMVSAIENNFAEAPAIIGFQLIGATIAALLFILSLAVVLPTGLKKTLRLRKLEKVFKFNNQGIKKTAGIELIGNVFWLIPIAALVVAYFKNYINFFELALSAAIGKMILVGAFEEMGVANFNPQIWFGKLLVTFVAQERFMTYRELGSEMSGLTTSLLIGLVIGYTGHPFNLELPKHT